MEMHTLLLLNVNISYYYCYTYTLLFSQKHAILLLAITLAFRERFLCFFCNNRNRNKYGLLT